VKWLLAIALAVAASGALLVRGSQDSSSAVVSETSRQPPGGLTARGRLLWNLEALLGQTFGDREVSASARANFSCAGSCAPLAKYSLFRYTFMRPRGSSFHASSRRIRDASFGNYLIPVRIRGRVIACDRSERRFLVKHLNGVSLTLACLVPQP